MASHRTPNAAMLAQAPDGHGSGRSRPRSQPAVTPMKATSSRHSVDELSEEGTLGPEPPPLPDDPVLRAELRKRLERGIAAARAGQGEDWEVVHARLRARLNLPPL